MGDSQPPSGNVVAQLPINPTLPHYREMHCFNSFNIGLISGSFKCNPNEDGFSMHSFTACRNFGLVWALATIARMSGLVASVWLAFCMASFDA